MVVKKVKVIDVQGNPLVGVHVFIIGKNASTITDQSGIAMVQHTGNENIMFSHLGKETRTININQINADIILQDSIEQLDDVIIVAKPKANNSALWLIGLTVGALLLFGKKKKEPKKVNL